MYAAVAPIVPSKVNVAVVIVPATTVVLQLNCDWLEQSEETDVYQTPGASHVWEVIVPLE